jgi:transposase
MPKVSWIKRRLDYGERKRDTEDSYTKIVEMHTTSGLSCRAIAAKLDIGKSTVSRYLAHWKAATPLKDIRPRGLTPKITPQTRSVLGQIIARLDVPTSRSVSKALLISNGVAISPRTVRRHLDAIGYRSSVPRAIPLLTDPQLQNRIRWCIEHQEFSWDSVWFSDETYIEINRASTPVWHKKGDRPTVSKPKFSAKIMCWAAISMRFKTKLAVVPGTMTAMKYVETVDQYLLRGKSRTALKNMVFQQDGASCHTAKLTKTFFLAKGIRILPWPANSPDLSPIENMWSVLKQKVECRAVKSAGDLATVAQEEWNKIDMEIIKRTIDTMGERVSQVINRDGLKCDY